MAELASNVRGFARLASRSARFVVREPGSALLVVRMAAWVAALSLLVKFLPLPRVMRLLTPRRRGLTVADPSATQERMARLLDALLGTDFWVFTPICWKRAPVLHRFLALRGIESRIVFGVRKEDEGVLAGHAWLEAGGRPLLEAVAPNYKETFSFPS